ncbi:MAG: thioesterase family protein [Pseudomonadota bacterium]
MNLFFRRLWVIFLATFASKSAPLDHTFVRTYRVWLTDQDMFMHMTNSRYLSFSDLARLNLLLRSGMMKVLRRNKWKLEICAQTRTITRMLKTPNAFQMSCEVQGWSDKHIAFNHEFKRRGRVHASVNTLMRVTDADGNEVAPQRLIDALNWSEASPKLSELFLGLAQELENPAS